MNAFGMNRISPVLTGWYDTAESPLLGSSDSYGRRRVEHYELELILSSRSGCILHNDMPVPTLPGSLLIRFPGMTAEGIGVYHSIYVTFDLDGEGTPLLEEGCLRCRMGDGTVSDEEEGLFRALQPGGEPSLARTLRDKAGLLTLLSRLAEKTFPPAEERQEGRLRRIQGALRHIRLHYREPITEKELADAAGYSVYHFCRLFRELTGFTPTGYLLHYRAEKARVLLLASDEPLETVMERAGFHNYSYFWRSFRRIYGCPPSEYRRRAYGVKE